MTNRITHVYNPGGLDLRNPLLLKSANSCLDGFNFVVTKSGNLMTRPGYKSKANDSGTGYGLVSYEKREPFVIVVDGWGAMAWGDDEWGSPTTLGSGTIDNRLVALASIPKIWTNGIIEVTPSDTLRSIRVQSSSSDGSVDVVLYDDSGSTVDDTMDATSTIATLVADITADADWTATVTEGDSSVSAKYLDYADELEVLPKNTASELSFGSWTAVNTTVADPMPATENKLLEDDYENADAESMEGVLYVTNGFDAVHKYDGQTFYKAGLPDISQATVAVNSTVSSTMSGAYKYRVSYIQYDNIGNIIEGNIAAESASVTATSSVNSVNVTLTNIEDGDGYNTNCAIVAGAQSSTNVGTSLEKIIVDDGSGGTHSMNVGDTAFFYDTGVGDYVTKTVSAVTSSSITLESSITVTVDDNQVISNNLRIAIYRTNGGGATFNLVAEIPNDAYSTTQVYNDTLDDTGLGADLITPEKTPAVPPACRYATQWRNQLILAGDPQNVTRVYYSESASGSTTHANPENFPATNYIEIGQGGGGRITGISVFGSALIIFTEDRIFAAEGNLALDQIRVDQISDSIGCIAHHTIQTFGEKLYFLHRSGVYCLAVGQGGSINLISVSESLDALFNQDATPFSISKNTFQDSMKRATSAIWSEKRYYLLNLPQEDFSSGELTENTTNSITLVLDLDINQWFVWKDINAIGGFTTFNDGKSGWLPWWITRGSSNTRELRRFNYLNAKQDYVDNGNVITMSYLSQWDYGSSPRTRKFYTDIYIDRFTSLANLGFTPSAAFSTYIYKDFRYALPSVSPAVYDSVMSFSVNTDDEQLSSGLREIERRSITVLYTGGEANNAVFLSGWSFEAVDYRNGVHR